MLARALPLLLFASPALAGEAKEIPPETFYAEAARMPVKRATAKQAAAWLGKGKAVLLDLRSREAYEKGHLRGALSLPATELTDEALAKAVPSKTTKVVLYCDDNLVPMRRVALTTLGLPAVRQLGYGEVYRLENLWSLPACRKDGGFPDLRAAGCPPLFPLEAKR